ncbi:MAG: hypothetical protein E5W94_04230 [Mesorhizobium sp.]|nr:MAG: hypothetical protein E5W94_04230 [Mesorhizobium sp.]
MAIGNMRTPAGMNGKHQPPPEIDTTRPSIARAHDYVTTSPTSACSFSAKGTTESKRPARSCSEDM